MAQISRRAALLGVVGLWLAGCSKPFAQSSVPPTPPSSPSPIPSATPGPAPSVDMLPRWPLTGRLLKNEDKARHAAVAVKVPDNRREHPQRGINKADIVFVELDGYRDASGYSGTRLVPVFHSRMADSVAPVRSIRPVDIPLLSPIHALIGNTGASPWVVNYVERYRAHLEGLLSYMNTLRTGSYGIDRSRVYTLNGDYYYDKAVVCHPAMLARQTKRFRSGPPQPYFPFASTREEVSALQGKRGRSIRIPYQGDSYFMGYDYHKKKKRYLRSMPWGPHVLADGIRVSTDNVLVIKAKQRYGKIFRGRGHDEPLHDIVNARGKFYYFNRGRYVIGTWRKGKVQEPFEFTLNDGSPLKMAPGRTFVELPNVGAKLRIKARSRSI
ncbi:MAG TPA: DUF3048 domain-containing protein [Propionibacteriaceae bacterium]|nr:DUF3048 domain-containing protein [Propionibacteriaceae bacterium]